ncbi:hypothetical protein [Longitalea arenae]|uniref:hypothetical protein n=1 Tax=Longitalea arenae TaxID=2812558 RepID=UPI0019679721|nr:hypothetical protein [Longitalea arenae]
MKFLFQLLAALLLWLFIACNNRGAQSGKTTDTTVIADMELVQMQESMPAPDAIADSKFTPPMIVKMKRSPLQKKTHLILKIMIIL